MSEHINTTGQKDTSFAQLPTQEVTVRQCLPQDYEAIHQLNTYALGYSYPLEKTRCHLDAILKRPTDKVFVACIGSKIVGYIHGCHYECTYNDPLINIMALAVDEGYRCHGIGRMLLCALEDWAISCSCSGVRLVSGAERSGAHQFYQRCGYHYKKQQKNFIKLL